MRPVLTRVALLAAATVATTSCAAGGAGANPGAAPPPVAAAPQPVQTGAPRAQSAAAPQPRRSLADLTKQSRRYDGLFTIFQDTVTGETRMLVRPEQVGREFIYWSHTVDAPVDAGRFRGNFGDNKVFRLERAFDRLSFVTQPTNLYFDPASPLHRAKDANVSSAVMAVVKIVATDPTTGALLVEADDVLLSESLQMVKPPSSPAAKPGQFFTLGKLSRAKSQVRAIRSYPANTDVVVDYVYENEVPLNRGGDGVVDPRFVTVRVQHSMIAMPENDYRPRFEDPRIGYFTNRQTDMLSADAAPYRDLVNRWHLVKRDPSAALSEPVEPIIWWIENTTPHELRDVIRDGVLAWNEAFEQAGFRNAMVVRVQPDDADWDAGDIRYNVLRWTSSPNPPFGGYGPRFTNPRTGEILGADIMLEWVAVTNRLRAEQLFDVAAMPPVGELEAPWASGFGPDARWSCEHGLRMQESMLFGRAALLGLGATEVEIRAFTRQYVLELILHEVGHTLGLNHNMMASFALSRDDIQRPERGIAVGSVMDYSAVNVAAPGQRQGPYFSSRPGPYDRWAIEWGYSPALADTAAERARLAAIAARSTEKALVFGNDADDMRSPGGGIDPRVNTGDLTDDAIGWAADRIRLTDTLLVTLRARYEQPGRDQHALRGAYLALTGQRASALTTASRFIGGVYRERAVAGQAGATRPFTPVPRDEQKRAMALLARHAFAPDAWQAPDGLLDHLMLRRRGYDFRGNTEDPKLHARVLTAQRSVLAHLTHPVTLQRITDSRLYGNTYPVAEMMADLTTAIFAADARADVNTQRQNLQIEYVGQLAKLLKSDAHDHVARSAALQSLRRIDALMASRPAGNLETQAHTQHVRHAIRTALDAD